MSVAENAIRVDSNVVRHLNIVLAETNIETLKAQNYHCNVVGQNFASLHALFQEIYEDHFQAQDELAERIRTLGDRVDGRYTEFLKISAIKECSDSISASIMVRTLADDQRILSDTFNSLAQVADDLGDVVTSDLAIQRANVHNKFEWILRSHLQ